MNEVRIYNLSKPPATLENPSYATKGDDAVDLMACFSCEIDDQGETTYSVIKEYSPNNVCIEMNIAHDDTYELLPHYRVLIPTGIKIALPANKKFTVKSRSGLALKSGIRVMNSPGTVDEPYRGMVGVILINDSEIPFKITHGMKIAQGALEDTQEIQWVDVDQESSLGETERGEGGFGHSDNNNQPK